MAYVDTCTQKFVRFELNRFSEGMMHNYSYVPLLLVIIGLVMSDDT